MLHESVRVSSILQRESKRDLFILGDTSYGRYVHVYVAMVTVSMTMICHTAAVLMRWGRNTLGPMGSFTLEHLV